MSEPDSVNLIPVPLEEAFPSKRGRRLAVIGAGGKSTTIGRIADLQAYRDPPVAVTTTTRMQLDQASGPVHESLSDGLLDNPPAMFTLARKTAPSNGKRKLSSPSSEDLDRLLNEFEGRVLIEADGARRSLLKVHRDHEPVVPEEVDAVMSIFRGSVVGESANEDTVHAMTEWGRLFPGQDTITPETIVRLFEEDHGYQVSEDSEHWLAVTMAGGLRQDLVDLIADFPDSFWNQFDRVVVLENRNIFHLHLE